MKNKNGFVFVETIVVCSILAVSLITIYASFVLLVNEQKKRNKYDQAVYNYRMYNIAKELNESLTNCDEYKSVSSSLDLDITSLYYVSAANVKNFNDINSNQLNEYIKTINPIEDTCLLIGEFEIKNPITNKNEYYYSHITLNND